MASCTSVFTGLPLTAGVGAPNIEYLVTGNQLQRDIRQRYPASMPANISRQYPWHASSSIRSGAIAAHVIPKILIVRNSAIGGVKEFAIDTGDK
jgi:hypothetical protein